MSYYTKEELDNARRYGLCWCGMPRQCRILEREDRGLYATLVCTVHGEDCE